MNIRHLIMILLPVVIVSCRPEAIKEDKARHHVDNLEEKNAFFSSMVNHVDSVLDNDTLVYNEYVKNNNIVVLKYKDVFGKEYCKKDKDLILLSRKQLRSKYGYSEREYSNYITQIFVNSVIDSYSEEISLEYIRLLLLSPNRFFNRLILIYHEGGLYLFSDYPMGKHIRVIQNFKRMINAGDSIEVPFSYLPSCYHDGTDWSFGLNFAVLKKWLSNQDIKFNTITLDDVRRWLEISPKDLFKEEIEYRNKEDKKDYNKIKRID